MLLLRNADVFSPRPLGLQSLLIGGGIVLWMGPGKDLPALPRALAAGVTEIDCAGLRLIPGLIDGHVHVTGGGGEAGFKTRVPAVPLTRYTLAGVTTVVGLLGTDDVTRGPRDLLAQIYALREEGLNAFGYAGGYHVPLATLTGSVRGDLVLLEPLLGIGELAISDHRSSQPTFDEILRLAADAHVSGLMTGKAGVLHLHLGDGPRGLDFVCRALSESEIPVAETEEDVDEVADLREVQQVFEESQTLSTSPAAARPATPTPHTEDWTIRLRRWLRSLRPGQSLMIAAGAAVVLLMVLVGLSRLAPRPLTAVAVVGGGEAMVLRAHNESYRVYGDGDILKVEAGDHILAETGTVTLTHFADQVAVVEPGAHVELETLDDANGGTQVEMYVYDGVLRNVIDTPLEANDRYVVHAPNLAVTAHGTEFEVEALSDLETLVTTRRGVVEVQMGDVVAQVPAGKAADALVGRGLVVQVADSPHGDGHAALLVVVGATNGINVLAAPQAEATVLGQVRQGQALQVTGQDTSGEWYQVCCIREQAGWMRAPIIQATP